MKIRTYFLKVSCYLTLCLDLQEMFNKDERVAHKYFIDLRSKHLAHFVNVFEFSKCYAELSPITQVKQI